MSIVSRNCGEHVHLGDDISVTVLGIDRCEVKLGVCSGTSGQDNAASNERLASIRSEGSRYYLFPQGGPRTLVVRCEKGKSLSFNGTSRLTVLNITAGGATLRIAPRTSLHSS